MERLLKSKCTSAAMCPFIAVNTDSDVNVSPLSLIVASNVFKAEEAMKQFEEKTSSSVSPSLLFHLLCLQPKPCRAGCCVKLLMTSYAGGSTHPHQLQQLHPEISFSVQAVMAAVPVLLTLFSYYL